MRIELTSEPGARERPNEDYASAALPASGCGGVLAVLDGVTPPAGDVGCAHSVPWFTARLGGALLELAGSLRELSLPDCLARAIDRTAAAHRSHCDLAHPRTPQATVVAARWDETTVEHLVLADSVLLLEHADGSVHPVRDPRLSQLPDHLQQLSQQVHCLPDGSPERAEAARQFANGVEELRNAPDGSGFYTAAADPEVAARAVTGSTPRGRVRTLLALTDGATRWTETFHLGDWADLLALVRTEGTASLVARVRTAEAADPAGTDFPRGKRHDDASALLAVP